MSDTLRGRKARQAALDATRLAALRSLPGGPRVKAMRDLRADGWTFAEIGDVFQVSRQRAEQIVNEGRPRRPRPPKKPDPLTREQKQRLLKRVLDRSGKSLVRFAEDDLARHARTVRSYVHGHTEVPKILVSRLQGLAKLYGAVDELAAGAASTSIAGTLIAWEP